MTNKYLLLIGCLGLAALAAAAGIAKPSAAWQENWDAATTTLFLLLTPGESQALPNRPNSQAEDGKALELRLAAGSEPGPGNGPEIETHDTQLYGTYSTRLKTADCSGQPNAGVVTGYFIYFNDGSDNNGDGLPDNTEIDFEWLCAEPQTIYLTMWTDYRDADAAHKSVGRAIDLQTGEIRYTCYFETFGDCQPLTGVENQPETVTALPGYDSSAGYYVYGFQWTARRVTWWMEDPQSGQRITLWDYQGLERIPTQAAYYMTNVWHTSDWTPPDMPDATAPPNASVSLWVDWTRFQQAGNYLYLPAIRK